jgi:hypothetical protein
MSATNYDTEYKEKRYDDLTKAKWQCFKSANLNYTLRIGQEEFKNGFWAGALVGLYMSRQEKKVTIIPKYALGIGASWSLLNMWCSLFRNQI